MCRVDIEGTTERNRQAPEILAWKNYHLEVLVEMYKFKQLQPCIMQSSQGMQVQRMEERAWRKKMKEKQKKMEEKMEEKKGEMVALLNQLISLQTRESGKAE